jgi:hypothetical protein
LITTTGRSPSSTQNEPGLGHGAVHGIYQEKDRVHYFQDPFHLSAEIGVAGCVYDIDLQAVVPDGQVLGEDRDPTLPLQVVGVHDPFRYNFIGSECPRMMEHGVHEGGFAVVNVGDNSDVTDLCSHMVFHFPAYLSINSVLNTISPALSGVGALCVGGRYMSSES